MTLAISVCIPAYNRAALLAPLLDSIIAQDFANYEIVICEDASPERAQIAAVARDYGARLPGRLRYFENERNLGYDGNLRRLVERAGGRYCLFMGNDDLMCPGALVAVAGALRRYPDVGVLVRSYADFDETPERIGQEFKYFPEEKFFPAGAGTVATLFRRSTVISGMVIHREVALRHATVRFDGTLLYQLWLVGNILTEMNGVFLPQVLVLRRNNIPPDFGHSEAERGKFVPREHTPESSLYFMRGVIEIASNLERERKVPVYAAILRDYGNYSYPFLAIQADQPAATFIRYWWRLGAMGFGRSPLYHLYFLALLALGPRRVDRLVRFIKKRLGHTPALGDIYRGRSA